jgi:hypothetical protein
MTTAQQIKTEIDRQTARLAFTTDPQHQRILARSIADLIDTLKAYPTGLVWCAEPPVEG